MVLTSLARAEAVLPVPLGSNLVERVGPIPPGTTLIALTSTVDDDLPGAIAHYTSAGVQTHVFFADPLSFQDTPKRQANERQQAFLSSLLGAQAAIYLIRRNDLRQIQPEQLSDAVYIH
jgi:hypothetical protein